MGRQSERRRKGRGARGPRGGGRARRPPARTVSARSRRVLPGPAPLSLPEGPASPEGEEAGRRRRSGPRRAPLWQELFLQRRREGAAGRSAERGAHPAARRPARPPARRAPGGRAERFQMWRRRAGPGARRGAHGAGHAEPTRARLEPQLARSPAPRPTCRPDTPLEPRPGPRVLPGRQGGEASGAQFQEGLPSAHLESRRVGPLSRRSRDAKALLDRLGPGRLHEWRGEARMGRDRAGREGPRGGASWRGSGAQMSEQINRPGFLNSSEAPEHVCYSRSLPSPLNYFCHSSGNPLSAFLPERRTFLPVLRQPRKVHGTPCRPGLLTVGCPGPWQGRLQLPLGKTARFLLSDPHSPAALLPAGGAHPSPVSVV